MLKYKYKYQICFIILLFMTMLSFKVIHVLELSIGLIILDLISLVMINRIEKLSSDLYKD